MRPPQKRPLRRSRSGGGTGKAAARLGAVAKYHIQLRTESIVSETLTVERDDLTGLRVELARFVGELLKDHAGQIWIDEDWRVDVTDETGLILFVMQISATDTPATRPMKRPGN